MTNTDQRQGDEQDSPDPIQDGFEVTFTATLGFHPDELVAETGITPNRAKETLIEYIRREGLEAGDVTVTVNDEVASADEHWQQFAHLDPTNIGIFRVSEGHQGPQTWLLPTTDAEAVEDLVLPWFDNPDDLRIYFEDTLAGSLHEMEADGSAQLVE